MKLLVRLLSCILLICCLNLTAYAHQGKTDSNGGHIDHSTGDYHYHHGYTAHAHFDIDGDGTIDCPYNFDDQTDHSSGTASVSYSDGYNDGNEDGYLDGYADGYKKGKTDGQEDGYASGEMDTTIKYKKQLIQLKEEHKAILRRQNTIFICCIIVICILFLVITKVLIARVRKNLKKTNKQRMELLESNHASHIEKLNAAHKSDLTELNHDYERRTHLLEAKHASIVEKLNTIHESELYRLHVQFNTQKRLALLDKIAAGEDPSIQLPKDIHLKQLYTPIKGTSSKEYPYGEYSVFVAPTGKKYHCKRDCVSSAKLMHFFDLPQDTEPCSKCVPKNMYPHPLPEWYTQIHSKLDAEYENILAKSISHPELVAPREEVSPSSQPTETYYLMEAANGMLVRVPESKLESWQAAQDKQRQGIKLERTPQEQRFVKEILSTIYGHRE